MLYWKGVKILKEELFNKLKYCKLSGIIEAFDRVHKETLDNSLSHVDFIDMLLDEEVINRENNRYNRLLKNDDIVSKLITFLQSYGMLLIVIFLSVAISCAMILIKKPKEILSKIS